MAFILPTFNLTANVFRYVGPAYAFHHDTPANLAMGRRIAWIEETFSGGDEIAGFTPTLLVPPLTDVRDRSCGGLTDVIEVPAGTGRWYAVACVDDVGKGFPNEHRLVTLAKVGWLAPWPSYGFAAWPSPIP